MRILGGRGRVEFHDALLKDINIFILDFAIPIRVLFYRIHTQNNIHARKTGVPPLFLFTAHSYIIIVPVLLSTINCGVRVKLLFYGVT